MNITSKLLFALSGRLPCRIISDKGVPYLERYFVAQLLGVTIYLHRFVGSDPDRGLHDHPWSWARSLVLSGEYDEETRSGIRTVRWWNKLTGDTFHRVILPPGRTEAWTLFMHGRYVKTWGFWHCVNGIGATWQPFRNHGHDGLARWWKHAPVGRDCNGRMPA